MNVSELTLEDVIDTIQFFCPVKVSFNGDVFYNDYDDMEENEDGICGEVLPLTSVKHRIGSFKKSLVHDIHFSVVDFHHTVVSITGEYIESEEVK